ncbi:MAG: AEC family transporter [Peptococcaceae bacterium]|nr:AEC family transporter [Peptococcaceae bacterium]
MDSFLLALNIVLPLFCLLVLGLFLKTRGLMPEPFVKQLNAVLFKAFFPTIIFYNIYHSADTVTFHPQTILFFIGTILVSFFFLCWIIPRIEPEQSYRGVIIQGIFRSNFVLFGLPITASVYDNQLGTTAVLIAFVVPLFNVLSVVILEIFRGKKPSVSHILKGIFTNPLIIGSVIGILFLATGLELPYFLEKTIADVAGVTTPLALIALGASFNFQSANANRKKLAFCVISRLLICPAVFLPIGVLFGLRQVELLAYISMLSAPTSVSTFTMAQQMGGDSDLAGQIVVFTSMLSAFTIFLWIFLISQLGLL